MFATIENAVAAIVISCKDHMMIKLNVEIVARKEASQLLKV